MSLLPKPPFRYRSRDRFEVNLDDDDRDLLGACIDEFRETLQGDDDALRRLFPVAYVDDPDRDRDYQQLMRGELFEARFAALDTMEATLRATELDEPQLSAWLQAVNSMRLVLGTRLDAGPEQAVPSEDDPNFVPQLVYSFLGNVVGCIVWALSKQLPPPSGAEPPAVA